MSSVELDLKLLSKAFSSALKDVKKQTDDFEKSTTQSFRSASTAFEVFKGSLAAEATIKAFDFLKDKAKELFKALTVETVEAAAEAEAGMNRLNAALAATGQYSEDASDDMANFAEELQNTTRYSDDAVISSAALIQTLARLSTDGLKEATKASLDLASALGIDLDTASRLVAKSANGNVEAFKRYGVVIEKGTTNSETFANALSSINDRFGGRSQADVKSFSGGVERLKNQFNNIQESIGETVIKNGVLLTVFSELSKAFSDANNFVKGNKQALTELVGQGIVTAIDATLLLVDAIDILGRTGRVAFNGLGVSTNLFKTIVGDVLQGMGVLSKETAASFSGDLSNSIKKVNEALNQSEGSKLFSDRLTSIRDKAKEALDAVVNGTSQTTAAFLNANGVIVDDEQKKEDKLKDIRLQAAISQEEVRLANDADELARKDANFQALVTDLGLEQAVRRQAEINMTTDKQEQERLRFQTTIDTNKKTVEDDKRVKAQIKAADESRLRNYSIVMSSLADITALGGKSMFAATKALNLASATTSGWAAVQAAWASAPFPANLPGVAAVTAQTLANVARIVATKPPAFAQGGVVPGNSFAGDNVIARVNSGEMIFNKRQQTNLLDIANGNGNIRRDIVVHTSVNIDGETIARAVSRQVADGFALGAVT